MAEPVLRIDRLSKQFGGLAAVSDVSLELRAGELHAVIGPNGAGKTTLLNLLSGDLSPSGGSVCYKGREIAGLAADRIARLGIGRSYQKTNIFAEFQRVRELPAGGAGAALRRDALRPSARFRYARSTMPPRRALRTGRARRERESIIAASLSHGEQRQLEIAMTLATSPDVLLLDEPLAGMGAEEAQRMVALIDRLAADHAILLVEHDMDAVFSVARDADRHGQRPRARERRARCRPPAAGAVQQGLSRRGAGMSAPPLVEAQGLHTFYGRAMCCTASISRIRRGETVALMGRNGMGKTTLLRSLLGLTPPRRGEVLIRRARR